MQLGSTWFIQGVGLLAVLKLFVFSWTPVINCSRVQCYAFLNTRPWRQVREAHKEPVPSQPQHLMEERHQCHTHCNTHWTGVWLVSRDSLKDSKKKIISCACLEELKPVSLVIQHAEWNSLIAKCNTHLKNWLNFKLSQHKQRMLVVVGTHLHPFLTQALHWGEWSASHPSLSETEFLNILLHAITVMKSIQ
jgi:hypothetical protein